MNNSDGCLITNKIKRLNPLPIALALAATAAVAVWAVDPHLQCVGKVDAGACVPYPSCQCDDGTAVCCIVWSYTGTCNSCVLFNGNAPNMCAQNRTTFKLASYQKGDCYFEVNEGNGEPTGKCTCVNLQPGGSAYKPCDSCTP